MAAAVVPGHALDPKPAIVPGRAVEPVAGTISTQNGCIAISGKLFTFRRNGVPSLVARMGERMRAESEGLLFPLSLAVVVWVAFAEEVEMGAGMEALLRIGGRGALTIGGGGVLTIERGTVEEGALRIERGVDEEGDFPVGVEPDFAGLGPGLGLRFGLGLTFKL